MGRHGKGFVADEGHDGGVGHAGGFEQGDGGMAQAVEANGGHFAGGVAPLFGRRVGHGLP